MKLRILVFLIALAAGCASVEQKTAQLDAELGEIAGLWVGDFGGEASLPPSGGRAAIFHRVTSIVAPQFGERVLVYQLHRDSLDGPLLQQKVFAFDTDPRRTDNRMRAWVFSPDQLDPNVATSPSKWRTLNPADLKDFPDGCAFRWRDTRAGFSARVSAKECRFASQAFGQAVRPDMRYELTRDSLTWDEQLNSDDGESLASTGGPLTAERVGPLVDVRWNHYDVRGDSFAEIRRDLFRRSPVVVDGETRDARTDWNVSWTIETSATDTGCGMGQAGVRVDVSTLLPRLLGRDGLPDDVTAAWDLYMDARLEHQLRHQRIAVEAASAIRSRLSRLPEAENCETLLDEAERVASDLVAVARRRDRQFDLTTDFGYTDGAEFPRSAPRSTAADCCGN